eukprot:204552_1
MAQCFVESTAPVDGEVEGNNDNPEEPRMSTWLKQHGLNDNVLSALQQNGVDSLNDFLLLESAQDINEFVNSLGIKPFMVKKKLAKAIKEFQTATKSKNHHCDNDAKEAPKGLRRKAIRWEALESKMEKKDRIKIQSKKSEEIKIHKTKEERKQRLSETRNPYTKRYMYGRCDGYFTELGDMIKSIYEECGVVAAGTWGVLTTIYTIIPVLPVIYAIGKHKQSKEDQNLNHKKHYNVQSKAFNDKLRQIKRSEEYILSK